MVDKDEKAIMGISRQEILTGLIWVILGFIPAGGIAVMVVIFQNPNLVESITVTGSVDLGKFIDKIVESYDAFLLLLGVSVGSGGTIAAVKLGKVLAEKPKGS